MGLSIVIASSFALNSSLYQNKGGNSKSAKDYDFYLQYNKLNQLSPSYFTNKVAGGFEKIKIDVLPNHSDILLNNTKINAGDEINFGDLAKLAIFPKIDEYDNFKWSAVSGSNFINTIVSKFGVGGGPSISRSILSNDTYTFDLVESEISSTVELLSFGVSVNFQLTNFIIREPLPSNGTLTFNNIPVTSGQIIPINQISNLIYTPNLNYTGIDFINLRRSYTNEQFPSPFESDLLTQITINNRPPTTIPQAKSGIIGDILTFPAFSSTDSDSVGPATFTHTAFPDGFVCTESNAGQVGNIISCVVGPSVVPGSYTFSVTPVDSLGLAGTPVVYTMVIAQNIPFQGNNGGGAITITANIYSATSSSLSLNYSTLSVSSISILPNSASDYSSAVSSQKEESKTAVSKAKNYSGVIADSAKGFTVRTGGF